MSLHNNSTSIKLQRPSDLNNGKTMLWKFNPMEDQQILDSPQVSHQDGGNSSSMMELSSPMKKERLWTFQVTLMLNKETSKSTRSTEKQTSNGMSSMLMNGRVNLSRENSMKNLVYTLKEISTSFHKCQATNIST